MAGQTLRHAALNAHPPQVTLSRKNNGIAMNGGEAIAESRPGTPSAKRGNLGGSRSATKRTVRADAGRDVYWRWNSSLLQDNHSPENNQAKSIIARVLGQPVWAIDNALPAVRP
jgi:hypothetical protein